MVSYNDGVRTRLQSGFLLLLAISFYVQVSNGGKNVPGQIFPEPENECSFLLAQLNRFADEQNGKKIKQIKNTPPRERKPKTVDLTDLTSENCNGKMIDLRKGDTVIFQERTIEYWNTSVDNPEIQMFLKSGAKVSFSGKTLTVTLPERRFVLGDFLGAGNTIHAFALAEDSTKVIRLPFVPEAFRHEAYAPPFNFGIRGFMFQHPGKSANGVRAVSIHEYGDKYVVVDRVYGTLTSEIFLVKLLRRYKSSKFNEIIDHLQIEESNDAPKFEKLMVALGKLKKITVGKHGATISVNLHSKQLLWDELKTEWVLNDWE